MNYKEHTSEVMIALKKLDGNFTLVVRDEWYKLLYLKDNGSFKQLGGLKTAHEMFYYICGIIICMRLQNE